MNKYIVKIDNFIVNTIILDGISPISDLLGVIHYKKIGSKAYGQSYGQQLIQVNDNRSFLAKLESYCVKFVENHKKYSEELQKCKNNHIRELLNILNDIGAKNIKSIPNKDGYSFEISDNIINKHRVKNDNSENLCFVLKNYINNTLPFNINADVEKI